MPVARHLETKVAEEVARGAGRTLTKIFGLPARVLHSSSWDAQVASLLKDPGLNSRVTIEELHLGDGGSGVEGEWAVRWCAVSG